MYQSQQHCITVYKSSRSSSIIDKIKKTYIMYQSQEHCITV